ncbi:MAG: DUF3536 domain-containing protein, partial [Anaerolineae bacterium]|nr:DUF3536 domain-containing protein [Anaerolineae bacterium]
ACYKPNAEAGNFRYISYSFGESLLSWLQSHYPETYAEIIQADRDAAEANNGYGNALAGAFHHSILPLARRRDKRTQIRWGIAAFEHHFGHKPQGFWLPEMAVDKETLSVLADEGIEYTLLAARQIVNLPFEGGSGPYEIKLSRGRRITVFVRDDQLSSEISFNIHHLGGAGHWARNALTAARKSAGPMLLLATAGETFGHHYAGEEQFLYWLVSHEALAIGYRVLPLNQYFAESEPFGTVEIHEPSSWSDQIGLANWATGLGSENTLWKGALRRALDNVASEVDRVYEDMAKQHEFDPWEVRNQYVPVLLGDVSAEDFIHEQVPSINKNAVEPLQNLLTAEELTQRMYTSYTFTNNDLDSPQPRYAIACAAAALGVAQQATGQVLSERLMSDLSVVTASNTELNGA